MNNDFLKILEAISHFNRKDDKKITQSISPYMTQNNIRIMDNDTVKDIALKFKLNLDDKDIVDIETKINKLNNNIVDKYSFACYFMYSIVCILNDKRLNINLDLPIGSYTAFKQRILERVISYDG